MPLKDEISPGLVLHLDPDVLEKLGGTFTCEPALRVQGGHFFVCLAANATSSHWLPLYSNPGVGRELLPSQGRTGHPKWTQGTYYWHEEQTWTASAAAIVDAAVAGGDRSRPGSRNRLDPGRLPKIIVGGPPAS
jgi:hypothetical protein